MRRKRIIAKTPVNLTTYDIVTNPAIEAMRATDSMNLQVERKTQSTRFKDGASDDESAGSANQRSRKHEMSLRWPAP